jgi:hypothetical protein
MAMPVRQKRLVYLGLVVMAVVLFAAGALYGYANRHDPICPNGKAPVAQQDDDMGQVMYLCTNGETVTN